MPAFSTLLPYLPAALHLALRVGAVLLVLAVLGRERFLQVFQSEKVMSWRLCAAAAVLWFVCEMLAAGRLTDPQLDKLLNLVEILAALGTVKVVASRFAPKPTTDPTEQPEATTSPPGPLS